MVKDKKEFDEVLKQKIRNLIFDTHREVILNTPVDTGRLRSSIVVEEIPEGFIIGTNVEYAEAVELGTKPHEIRPVNKKALAFEIGGKKIIRKSVMHPGTEGSHMFLKGVQFFENNVKNL